MELIKIKNISIKVSFFSRRLKGLVAGGILIAGMLTASATAYAYGVNECVASRAGSDLLCKANDVSITGISVAPGSPSSCIGGTTFNVDLDVSVLFGSANRYDIGIFLSNDGKDPGLLPVSGGAETCNVSVLPTSSPFLDLDPNGGLDTCGDGNSSTNIDTETGAAVRLYDVPVTCQSINHSNGKLYIPFVVTWDHQSSPTGSNCTSILDPVANVGTKCNAPDTSVAADVIYGTVNAVVLPDITKTDGVTTVAPGDLVTYTVVITNTTGQPLSGAVFTDPATANLNVTNTTCTSTGTATCPTMTPVNTFIANMQDMATGITIPDMPTDSSVTFTISATVADPISPAYSSTITNTANVTVLGETNSATDVDTITGAVFSDLSTSTKDVIDLNGGEADPGDVLRYTITLHETAGNPVSGASVTDNIPAYVNSVTVVSIPTGSTDSSTGTGTGTNNTGYLNITGIDVPPNSSESIVFDVTIESGAPAGTAIDNQATINNPGGPGGSPTAPTVLVSPSAVPGTDHKKLYLYGRTQASAFAMSRVLPSGSPDTDTVTIAKGASATWDGNWNGTADTVVPLQLDNTIEAADVTLFLSANGTRKVSTDLYCSSDSTRYASTSGAYTLSIPATPTEYTFNLTSLNNGFSFPATCSAPNYWALRVNNESTGGTPSITVHPTSGADYSRVNLDSSNVIYVESLAFYDAPYPGGSQISTVTAGSTIYIRTTVSDPFGSFDITGTDVILSDANDTPMISPSPGAMSVVNDSGAATKTFEYIYTIPAFPAQGNWTARVDTYEGEEGTVSDYAVASFQVFSPPLLTVVKSASGPTANPGDEITYSVTITNSGGPAINVAVDDDLSQYTAWGLDSFGSGIPFSLTQLDQDGGGPMPSDSGLTLGTAIFYDESDSVVIPITNGGGAGAGYDGRVNRFELLMIGIMQPDGQFRLEYKVKVK